VSRDTVIGVCRALSGTGSIGVDITADTDMSAGPPRPAPPTLRTLQPLRQPESSAWPCWADNMSQCYRTWGP